MRRKSKNSDRKDVKGCEKFWTHETISHFLQSMSDKWFVITVQEVDDAQGRLLCSFGTAYP